MTITYTWYLVILVLKKRNGSLTKNKNKYNPICI